MSDFMIDDAAQRLYLNAMLGNPALFARIQHLIQPSFFDGNIQDGITFLKEFYKKHRGVPSAMVFVAGTKLTVDAQPLPKQDLEFVAEQIASFCQIRAVTEAVLKAPALIEKGDFGKMVEQIKLATQVQLHSDLGIEYFADPVSRLNESEALEILIPTGWVSVDDLIGGLGRQELALFTANSGGGKSVAMLNLAYNLLKQNFNGVYISLEMRDRVVAKRLDSMISRISGKNIFLNKLKVGQEVEMFKEKTQGRFFIKRMREGSTTADHISSYLRELEAVHGFRPDFVVVDYIDLMSSIQKHDGGNMFTKDKFVTEEVRAIGFDFDCLMISASQLGRCLDINSIIITEKGEVKLYDLQIGDRILSNEGYNEVLAKTLPERKKSYKVTLEDGSSITMSAEHRNPVFNNDNVQIGIKSINTGLMVGDILNTANLGHPRWYKIVSIEEVGDIETIDIQVSGNNLFYANNVLTHNSAIEASREHKSLDQAHIQGGISKINTSDLVIALVKDEAMAAAGEYRFEFLKSRNSNAVNKKLLMHWDADSLLISDANTELKLNVPKRPGLSLPNMKPGSTAGLAELLGRE